MGMIDNLRKKVKETGEKLRDKQDNYDGPWDKITHPEWFNDDNSRTKAHPKYNAPRDPKSSLPLRNAKGGSVKKMAKGGSVSSASKRADGIARKGKTRGKVC